MFRGDGTSWMTSRWRWSSEQAGNDTYGGDAQLNLSILPKPLYANTNSDGEQVWRCSREEAVEDNYGGDTRARSAYVLCYIRLSDIHNTLRPKAIRFPQYQPPTPAARIRRVCSSYEASLD